ncbi:MAG TPA: S24 family peptidase [Luteolibacter sp.]
MDITRETVNEWLEAHPGRGREWLAEQCGVGVAAIGHWLNKKGDARPIPAEHQITIRKLMEEDAAASQAKPPHTLVLEFDDSEYAAVEKAALKTPETIREWAKRLLNEAADLDVAAFTTQILHPELAPAEHWPDLYGGVAAGGQIATDASQEPVHVSKAYPDDHYLLRVFGQSMEPKIADGSLIVVKRWHDKGFPKKGAIVVYSDSHGSTLKEFAYRKAKAGEDADAFGNVPVLRSLNKAFKDVKTMDGGKIDAVYVETLG